MGCGSSSNNPSEKMGGGSSSNNPSELVLESKQKKEGQQPPALQLEDMEVLSNKKNLIKLRLDNHKLTEIPDAVFDMQLLEELSISDGDLEKIDPRIASLKNLKRLEFFANKLTAIPEEIFSLPNLEELNLYSNKIKKIPESINSCKSLQVLGLGGNAFLQMPPLDNLTNLVELKFQWGKTAMCGGSWENVPLQTLKCDGCRLSNLPRLPNTLVNVDVNKNFLTGLDGIEECKDLEEFMASNNQFETIPMIFTPSLVAFKMQENKLTSIPEEIGLAQSLKCLFLNGNKIEDVPEGINTLPNLIRVDMRNNPVCDGSKLDQLKANTEANDDGRYF